MIPLQGRHLQRQEVEDDFEQRKIDVANVNVNGDIDSIAVEDAVDVEDVLNTAMSGNSSAVPK